MAHVLTVNLECPSCAHDLSYLPGAKELTCGACGFIEPISSIFPDGHQFEEQQYLEQTKSAHLPVGEVTVTCAKCSGQFAIPAFIKSSECPFCSFNFTLENRASEVLSPSGIVPFALSEVAIHQHLLAQVKQNFFLSPATRKAVHDARVKGFYLPAYSFDFTAIADYAGTRGDVYYVKNDKGESIRRVRYSKVSGTCNVYFNDEQLVNSSLLGKVMLPSNVNGMLQPYSDAYLQDYRTECHNISSQVSLNYVIQHGQDRIISTIKSSIGGDEQVVDFYACNYNSIKYRHFYYPVWSGTYADDSVHRKVILASGVANDVSMEVKVSLPMVLIYFTATLTGLGILLYLVYLFGYEVTEATVDDHFDKSNLIGILIGLAVCGIYSYFVLYDYPHHKGVFTGIAATGHENMHLSPEQLQGMYQRLWDNGKLRF